MSAPDTPQTTGQRLIDRDRAELQAVAYGLLLNDEASVRRRKRLEAAGLIVFRGWELTPAGEDDCAALR